MSGLATYAIARLRSRPARSLLGAGGIVAASAMLGAAITVSLSLHNGFQRAAQQADLADVVARFGNVPAGAVRARAQALPNVRRVALRYVARNVELRAPRHDIFDATLEGVEPAGRGYAVVNGRNLTGPTEALVERGLARAWDLHPGSTILLGSTVPLRVVGIAVEPDNVAYPLVAQPRIYVHTSVARLLDGAGPRAANALLLWARDPRRLDVTLTQAREASFGLRSLQLVTKSGIQLEVGQAAGLVIALLVVFSTIALAASAAILGASAASEVQRRLTAIGVLRAIGASRSAIVLGHALESALVALPSAALGLALGWMAVRGPTASLLVSLNEVGPGLELFGVLAGALAGIAALVAVSAAIPAWTAARRPPVDALRGADVASAPKNAPLPAGAFGLGLRLLLARPLRTLTAIAVLSVSAGFALLMLSIASLLASLQTNPQAIGRSYQLSVAGTPSALTHVRHVPGVVDAGVRYETWATDSFNLGESFQVVAFDRQHLAFEAPPLAAGRRVSGPGEADVGLGLAQALNLHPGAPLAMQLQNGREVRFRVVGIVRALTQQGHIVYTTPSRLLAADPFLPSTLAVKTAGGASGHAQRELAANGSPASESSGIAGQGVQGWAVRNSGFVSVLVSLLRAIALINGLVCVYALVQILSVTATERRRAIAVIRAVGAGRGHVRRLFTASALGLAAAAAPVAILLERNLAGPLVAGLAAPYASISLTAGLTPLLAVVAALGIASLGAGALVARRAMAVPVTRALVEP